MYGAILGDIAGSRFEFSKPKGFNHKTVELFTNLCRYTDDTVLTIATKYAILNDEPYHLAYGRFARRYENAGYGNMFRQWFRTRSSTGYNSYGNGSAMRVSYIGLHYDTIEEVEEQAKISSCCTHDHIEGIRGAMSTAAAVYLAKNGYSKKEIAKYIHKSYGYILEKPLWVYRPLGKFDVTARGTVPLAIRCFLESDDWESCIRNVFSVKCDTDTVGCIAGGIADAYYGKTGFNEKELLKRYLVKLDKNDKFDTFLFDWAVEGDKG